MVCGSTSPRTRRINCCSFAVIARPPKIEHLFVFSIIHRMLVFGKRENLYLVKIQRKRVQIGHRKALVYDYS
nr:MAG TPA: hypothetical protein [Caudoviricetes sp.]